MRKFLFLFIFSTSLLNYTHAQIGTQKDVLTNTAKSLEVESRSNFSEAIIKSKQKGWPLEYKSKDNQTSSLIGIDKFGLPIYLTTYADPVQAITVNTHQVWQGGSTGFNLSGSSDSITNRIGVWDESSPRLTHNEFTGRLVLKDNASKTVDHPTHVAGIIMSKGVNPLAKGMSYGVKGAYAYDWNNDVSEMASAAANGLLISNHSYGTVSGWDYNKDSSRWEFGGKWNEKEDFKFLDLNE